MHVRVGLAKIPPGPGRAYARLPLGERTLVLHNTDKKTLKSSYGSFGKTPWRLLAQIALIKAAFAR